MSQGTGPQGYSYDEQTTRERYERRIDELEKRNVELADRIDELDRIIEVKQTIIDALAERLVGR